MSKERWGTRLGIILAVAGSAVGLGNFLRFPGQAVQNGGGAFMIPYFVALLLLGIPICWAEWSIGKYGGRFGFNSCPAIFGLIGRNRFWRFVGVLGLMIPVVVYMYYVVIESWCMAYAFDYILGGVNRALGSDPTKFAANSAAYFDNITGSAQDGLMLNGQVHISVVIWLLVFALNFVLIYRGLSKGIEVFCTWAMPVMAICATIVLIRVLTLGAPDPALPEQNIINGLGFMWNPHPAKDSHDWWSALLVPQTWLAAAGQIFFTLGVGFGIIVNYASYLRKKDEIVLSGMTACATNEFFEVCLGGMITIPAAFIFLGLAGVEHTGTFDLGFKTLPIVFMHMPGGALFGFLWFFMLFLAAITSSISMLQPAIAFLEEALGIGRRASVTILGLVTAIGSLFVIYFSKGMAALGTMDDWVGTNLIVLLALCQTILVGWVFGAERTRRFAMDGAEMRIPRLWSFLIKFVTPVYLALVLGIWAWNDLPKKIEEVRQSDVAFMTICVIVAVTVFFTIITAIAGPRWKAETRDPTDRRSPAPALPD